MKNDDYMKEAIEQNQANFGSAPLSKEELELFDKLTAEESEE